MRQPSPSPLGGEGRERVAPDLPDEWRDDSAPRQLRSNLTEAEIRLWSRLRRKQLDGFRFRRQQPIGPFIVDIFCPAAKLVVEVDGGPAYDA